MADETGANVGSAFIDVVPSADGFSRKLSTALKRHEGVFKALGVDLGDKLIDGMEKEVKKSKIEVKPSVDSSKAKDDIKKLKKDVEDTNLELNADADTTAAEAQLKAASRNRIVDIKAKINQKSLAAVKTSLAALSGGRALKNVFEPVKDSLMNLDKSVPKIAMVTGAIALLGATAMSSLGGLIALGGSLAQVGAAGLLLPGIFAGGAIAALTFGLALSDASKVLGDLGPKFQALKAEVSGNFWAQAETPIRNMVSTLLPQFQSQMAVTATALGNLAGKFSGELTQAISGVHLDKMFTGLNGMIKNLEAGIPGVTTAIQVLGVTGASYLPRMGTWLSEISNQFGSWLQKAQQSGQLNQWIETALVNLRALGSVVASTGSILNGLFKATQAAGFGGLVTFADTLQRIATTVNGPAFQGALIQVFQGAKAAMAGLSPAVAALGQMFVNLAPVIKTALGSLGESVGAVLTSVFQTLGSAQVATGLNAMIQGISGAFRTLAPTISALGPVVGAVFRTIGTFASALAPIIGAIFTGLSPVLTQILAKLNPFIAALGSSLLPIVRNLISVFSQWWPVILGVVGAIGGAVLAVQGINAAMRAYTAVTNAGKAVQLAYQGVMAAKTAVLHGVAIAQGRATLSTKANTLAQYAGIVATKLWRGAVIAATVAQRAFNLAMRMNPIGLIITGIMLLVGALVWFFTKTKLGKAIFEKVWGAIKTAIAATVDWFKEHVAPVFKKVMDAIVAGFKKFKEWISPVWDGLKNKVKTVVDWFKAKVAPTFKTVVDASVKAFQWLKDKIMPVWDAIKGAVETVIGWFKREGKTGLTKPTTDISNSWTKFKDSVAKIWGKITEPIKKVVDWFKSGVKAGFEKGAQGIRNVFQKLKDFVSPVFDGIKSVIDGVANWFKTNVAPAFKAGMEKVKQAFQPLIDAVKPIFDLLLGVLVKVINWIKTNWKTAILLLVAPFIMLPILIWQNREKIVQILISLVTWLISFFKPYVQTAIDAIGNVFKNLYNLFVAPVVNWIKAIFSAVILWFSTYVVGGFRLALTTLGNVFKWLYNTFVKPVVDWIKLAFTNGLNAVKFAFTAFKVGASAIWNAFKNALNTTWQWINVNIFGKLRAGLRIVKIAFSVFKTGASAIWTAFKNALNVTWQWIKTNIFGKIKSALGSLKTSFSTFKTNVASIWTALKNAISNVWNTIRTKIFTPIKNWLLSTLKNAFNNFKNNVSTVFKKVKGFGDTLWGGMKTIFGKLKDGASSVGKSFQTMKNTVKSAFEKARSAAKKPIKETIEFVNSPLISGINKVGKIFSLKKIPSISLKGFARGGSVGYGSQGSVGGYTGPGRKFEPGGIVHKGEYVIKKSSTSRIEKRAPGLLGSLNAGRIPPFASGGKVPGFAGGGMVWNNLWGIAKANLPGVRLTSAKRNGSGGSYHNTGRAVDLAGPRSMDKNFMMKIFNFLHDNYGQSSEIIYSPAGGRQVKNGNHMTYGEPVKSMHYNHVHWANKSAFGGPTAGAGGNGGSAPIDILDLVPGLKKFKDKLKNISGASNPFGKVLTGAGKWMFDGIKGWLSARNPFSGGGSGGGAEQWRGMVEQALGIMNITPNAGLINDILRRINQESGGNPRAVNNWDVNAQRGDPSKGLLQTIGSTYRSYAHPKYNKGVFDPLSNILASMRYAIARYGSLQAAYNRKGGYAGGGLVKAMKMDNGGWLPKGDSMIRNATSSPERIRTMDEEMFLQRSMAMSNREYDAQRENKVQIDIQVNGATDPNATANAVADKLNFQMRKHQVGAF